MAEPDQRSKHDMLAVVAICSLAVSVRLLFLARWAGTPIFSSPVGDELNFHQTALALLSDHSLVSFLYQPLYSYFLAGVYWLFGPDVGTVRTIQLAIGVGTTVLFYGLGRELSEGGDAGRWTGRLAGTIAALYGPQVFFEGQLLAPALTLPLTAGALWCLLVAVRRSKPWVLIVGGLLLGLACMGRPNLLVMLPAGLVWLLMRIRPWRWIWLSAGLLVGGVILGLSPSWIHNAVSGQGFVPVSSSGGHSFFIGNNPQATGGFHIPKGMRIDDSDHAAYRRSLTLLAERDAGRDLTPAEVSAYWWHRGLDFWAEHPGQALWLSGKKLLLELNSVERPIHYPYVFAQEVAPILGYLLSFGIVFPFAVLGVWFGWRRRAGVGLLLGCAGAYMLTLVAFYVADRYRILLLAAFIPLAGLGMVEFARTIRARGARRTWPHLLALAAAFAVTQLPLTSARAANQALVVGYNLMGKAAGERGNMGAAEKYFKHAIEIAGPGRGARARANLGLLFQRRGRLERARRLYIEAAQDDPDWQAIRVRLARLAESRGDIQQAIHWWREAAALMADPAPALSEIERLEKRGTKR
ncbi:MAG TPA: glycosyltransferase family 39 protein [Myxococcota bacterium]|nr:glycosyltransferase family 39 protein [Myxococcota bacterium]